MPHRKSVVVALVALTAFLTGGLQVSASPECPLSPVQPAVEETAPAPLTPAGIEPIALPFEEPKPVFRDCIGACVADRVACYEACGQDWNCRGWCDVGFNNCLSTCGP